MRIHTNRLTVSDLVHALPDPHLYVEDSEHGSRSHARAFEFRLMWLGPKVKGDGRRLRNTGNRGADSALSATWDEHGRWMATLFDIDPDAVIGPYRGRADFHQQTKNAYNQGDILHERIDAELARVTPAAEQRRADATGRDHQGRTTGQRLYAGLWTGSPS